MMVTITSMKKIQEPDLLVDHPHSQPHRLSATNNLSKPHPHRKSRHAKTKNRRPYPSEESNSSAISASTTLTSVSSIDGEEEAHGVIPNSPTSSKDGQVVIDGLDEDSPWSQQQEDDPSGHKKRSRTTLSQKSKSPPPPRTSWIRAKASSSSTTRHGSRLPCCCSSVTTKQLIVLLIVTLIVSVSLISLAALVLSRSHSEVVSSSSVSNSNRGGLDSNLLLSPSDISQVHGEERDRVEDEEEEGDVVEESENYDEYDESSSEGRHNDKSSKIDLKDVSRLSWNMLNNNQERGSSGGIGGKKENNNGENDRTPSPKGRHHHRTQNPPVPSSFSGISGGQEVVLPSKMIFTSSNGDLEQGSSSGSLSPPNSSENNNKKRSCCRTQKYAQVIKKEGCEPLTVTNRMCFGQCLSVWVPGLFASFPVCKPSRSSWKTVTLTCGKNRDRKRRVRIEKVRRCSCMEIDPTAAGSSSHNSDQNR